MSDDRSAFDILNAIVGAPAKTASAATLPLIAVLEDDTFVRNALRIAIGERYRMRVATKADELVSLIDEEVCAIVLDIKMAGRDGFAACGDVQALNPAIPIIFYSAFQDARDPYDVINDFHPFAFVTKDGNLERLVSAIDRAVRYYNTIMKIRGARQAIEKISR